MGNGNRFSETSFRFLVDVFSQQSTSFIFRKSVYLLQIELAKQQRRLCEAPPAVRLRRLWVCAAGKFKVVWLRHVTASWVFTCVCVCVFLSLCLPDGRGGFPEDDPGGREDGRRRAARKNVLLHDVEPPNQHTGHCTGISRYLKASCQFSSTSADSTPPRVLNIQYCLFMALIPLLFISISYSLLSSSFFLCVWLKKKDEWWLPCLIFPTIHLSSISVLGTDAKHRTSFGCIRKNVSPPRARLQRQP